MAGSTFQTNPIDLNRLLDECHRGVIQLPDFQRSWVWDEDRIKSLIASVSRAFPVGALMSLDTGGPVNFKPRPVEGAPASARQTAPQSLLLDGQQRMTSLYQVSLRGKVVETVTPNKKKVRRWFNKTPLSYRTNRIIGGVAPSQYITKLEKGTDTTPPIASQKLDAYLKSHLVDPVILRADKFETFMDDRQKQLLNLIEQAMGKAAYTGSVAEEGEDAEADEDTTEVELTMAAA